MNSVPADEEVCFWVKASDTGFGGYYSYATKKLSLSCVPFSLPCLCLNVFNLPCMHAEYVENSSRIILATDDSLIIGTLSSSGNIEKTEICTWKRVKYIGTKSKYEEKKAGHISNPLSCSSSSDILLYTQNADEKVFRGVAMDYVPDRDNCLQVLLRLKKKYIPKSVRERNSALSVSTTTSYDNSPDVSPDESGPLFDDDHDLETK